MPSSDVPASSPPSRRRPWSSLLARHRRHGVGGIRHFQRHVRDLRRFRRGGWNRHDLRRHHRNGAGPSNQAVQPRAPLQPVQPPAPLQPVVPDWLLAGPAAPRLDADENIDPALAAPPPPFWCPVHGWVVCPMHQYDFAVHDAPPQPPTRAVVESEAGAPLPRSPTVARAPDAPLVRVRDGDVLAFVSAPTGDSVFAFGSGVNGSSNHAVVDVDAVAPRLPSPTPATPPPSPRTGARRRLMALGGPLVSSPSSRRYGTWNPAALGLMNGVANGVSNGVASSHGLLGGSSSEEDGGAPGPSTRHR